MSKGMIETIIGFFECVGVCALIGFIGWLVDKAEEKWRK